MVTVFRTCMVLALTGILVMGARLGLSGEATTEVVAVPTSFPSDLVSAELNGVRYRVRMESTYGLGEAPVALVELHNPASDEVSAQAVLRVLSAESNPMSRVPSFNHREHQRAPLELVLGPGETKVLRVTLDAALTTPAPDSGGRNEGLPAMMLGPQPPFVEYLIEIAGAKPTVKSPDAPIRVALGRNFAVPSALARFQIDPAKVITLRAEVVRNARGEATELVAHVENRSRFVLPPVNVAAGTVDGQGAVKAVGGSELKALKPGRTGTLRWTLDGLAQPTVRLFPGFGLGMGQPLTVDLTSGATVAALTK